MGKKKYIGLDERIRHEIVVQELTGYRLAKMSGVSETVICRFLKGERTLTLPTASKLVQALGLELKPVTKKAR